MFGSISPTREILRQLGYEQFRWTRRNDTLDVWIDSGVSHEAVPRKRKELDFPPICI